MHINCFVNVGFNTNVNLEAQSFKLIEAPFAIIYVIVCSTIYLIYLMPCGVKAIHKIPIFIL